MSWHGAMVTLHCGCFFQKRHVPTGCGSLRSEWLLSPGSIGDRSLSDLLLPTNSGMIVLRVQFDDCNGTEHTLSNKPQKKWGPVVTSDHHNKRYCNQKQDTRFQRDFHRGFSPGWGECWWSRGFDVHHGAQAPSHTSHCCGVVCHGWCHQWASSDCWCYWCCWEAPRKCLWKKWVRVVKHPENHVGSGSVQCKTCVAASSEWFFPTFELKKNRPCQKEAAIFKYHNSILAIVNHPGSGP